MRAYIKDAADTSGGGGSSTADQVAQLAQLRDQGVITEEQFEQGKAKIFAEVARRFVSPAGQADRCGLQPRLHLLLLPLQGRAVSG